ncbi:MAG: hypothetical protein ACLUFN_10900 [Eubacterium sp.]
MKNINNRSVENAAKKANININEFKQAAESGHVEDFINKNMSKEASQKLKSILNDKSATEKLLSTPEAKELLNKLMNK